MKQYKVYYSKIVEAENEKEALYAIPQTVYGELKAVEVCIQCQKEGHSFCNRD